MTKARPVLSDTERSLFRNAVRGAKPIRTELRVGPAAPEAPKIPVQSLLDEHDALTESLAGAIPWEESMETGEELSFLRPGLARAVLKKLRRGHWTVQDELDLHGLTSVQARAMLGQFMHACARNGRRCVRVVHGKGLRSPNREHVLKGKVKSWLAQRDDVLAFCQAPASQGGSGALLVLLGA